MNCFVLFSVLAAVVLSGPCSGLPEGPGEIQARTVSAATPGVSRLPAGWTASRADRDKAAGAWAVISGALKDSPASDYMLHVFYVTYPGREAEEGYRERYDRVLKNIQLFFGDQMKANGLPPMTFKLDLDDAGKLVVHEIRLDKPGKEFGVESLHRLIDERANSILERKGVDHHRTVSLYICPNEYMGGFVCGLGNGHYGRAWVYELPFLDPRHLKKRLFYGTEYLGTVGQLMSIYMGTQAHEIGHAFSLRHKTRGFGNAGASLMGTGNDHYGRSLRGEGKDAVLHPADALVLASHPAFTGRAAQAVDDIPSFALKEMSAMPTAGGSVMTARIDSGYPYPCYAVLAYIDPPGGADYDASCTTAVPDADGRFSIGLTRPGYLGYADLRITALYADGASRTYSYPAWMTGNGLSCPALDDDFVFGAVKRLWESGDNRAAQRELKRLGALPSTPEMAARLARWERAVTSRRPAWHVLAAEEPSSTKAVSLADCRPFAAKTGFGAVCWDALLPSELGVEPFFFRPVFPRRFIMLHANGTLEYALSGQWNTLDAKFGMPVGRRGSVCVVVSGDGGVLYSSPVIREGQCIDVRVPVQGVGTLRIDVLDAGDGNTGDWCIVADPVLSR